MNEQIPPSFGARPSLRQASTLWICAGLVALVAVSFGPVAHHGFVNLDDEAYIVDNPYVEHGLTPAGIGWALTSFYEGNWHPLTWMSHMLDVSLFGMAPGPHHLVSVILHALSAAILFLALFSMSGDRWPSTFTAALFAVHPLRVESVAWAAERKDVLGGFFWMLTLLSYAAYAKRPSAVRYALVVLSLALGLMSKPMLVTLPFVLILVDLWPIGRFVPWRVGRREVLEKLPLLGLSAVSSAITLTAQTRAGVVVPTDALPLGSRLAGAAVTYLAYLRKAIWPVDLAVFYPVSPASLTGLEPALCAIALVAVSFLAIRFARRRPHLTVGWFWYLGTLVPVIGLVQVGAQAMADRYTYVPLVGIILIVAWGARDLAARWPIGKAVLVALACAAVLACVVMTRHQVSSWRDSRALFEHALQVSPDNFVAHNGLGIVSVGDGDLARAAAHFESALRAKPDYAFALNNLGGVLARQGKLADAATRFREALRIQPTYVDARFNLGLVLESQGDRTRAAAEYEEVLRIESGSLSARTALERVRKQQAGRP